MPLAFPITAHYKIYIFTTVHIHIVRTVVAAVNFNMYIINVDHRRSAGLGRTDVHQAVSVCNRHGCETRKVLPIQRNSRTSSLFIIQSTVQVAVPTYRDCVKYTAPTSCRHHPVQRVHLALLSRMDKHQYRFETTTNRRISQNSSNPFIQSPSYIPSAQRQVLRISQRCNPMYLLRRRPEDKRA